MNLIFLKQILLLENTYSYKLIHTYILETHTSSILDIDLQLPQQSIHPFKLHFLNRKPPQLEHIEKQLTQKVSKILFKNFSMLF